MNFPKPYEYNNPFPKSGTEEIYQNIINKVMKGMEDKLRSRGFDFDQIQMFTDLWKSKLNNLQLSEETEDNMYDNPESNQYQTDLYSQHMGMVNGMNHQYHPMSIGHQYKSSQDEYQTDSFIQKPERRMNDSLSYNTIMNDTNALDTSNSFDRITALNNLTERLDEMNDYKMDNKDDDSISDVTDDDEDEEEEKESDSRLVCLFNSVKHLQGKHRCDFSHCILKNGKKEYFFGKCLAEIESA